MMVCSVVVKSKSRFRGSCMLRSVDFLVFGFGDLVGDFGVVIELFFEGEDYLMVGVSWWVGGLVFVRVDDVEC